MKGFVAIIGFLLILRLHAQEEKSIPELFEQWEPVPEVIDPGNSTTAPSDAVVLFDGSNLDAWTTKDGGAAEWTVADAAMTVKPGTGSIMSKQEFGDCQIHLEWRSPGEVTGKGQGRGNSGVYIQGKYEVQVLDNYDNTTYPNGQAASIYKQHIPLVNACRPPGEWQSYDIIFTAPRFNDKGYRISPGRVTVLHNGVLVQNNVTLYGTSEYNIMPKNEPHGDGPIILQDHGNLVSFRNIWVRRL